MMLDLPELTHKAGKFVLRNSVEPLVWQNLELLMVSIGKFRLGDPINLSPLNF